MESKNDKECEVEEDLYSEEEDGGEGEAGEEVEKTEDRGLSEEQKAAMIRDLLPNSSIVEDTKVKRKKKADGLKEDHDQVPAAARRMQRKGWQNG